jgi:endonuclease YncB( thermonuclease family)
MAVDSPPSPFIPPRFTMRRTALTLSGFALVALSTLLALLLYQAWQERPATETELTSDQAQIATALTTTELQTSTGDTLTLAAIRAPQTGEPLAEEGKQAVRALTEGQRVRVEGQPSAAYLYLPDGQLLQAVLVAGGYAYVAPDAPTDALGESLRLAQAEAQANNLGIWAGQARIPIATTAPRIEITCTAAMVPDSIDGTAAAAFIGEERMVVFEPTRTMERSNGIVLVEGENGEGFGVIIPATLLTGAGNLAPEFLNRCVVVSGVIERDVASNAPRITLTNPEDLIVLR